MEYRRLGTIALGVRTLRAFRTDRQHRLVGCVQTPGLRLLRGARSPGVAFLAAPGCGDHRAPGVFEGSLRSATGTAGQHDQLALGCHWLQPTG